MARRFRSLRPVLTMVALAALALAGLALTTTSNAGLTASAANQGNSFSTGHVGISSDGVGELFTVTGLAPGRTVAGCIVVTYESSVRDPAETRLYSGGFVGSTSLAEHLNLTVEEGTGGSFGRCDGFEAENTIVANETVARFAASRTEFSSGAGQWAPVVAGESRTYRPTIGLDPEAPSSLQQQSLIDLGFAWEAEAGFTASTPSVANSFATAGLAPPTDLTATSGSPVILSWDPASDPLVAGYRILRAPGPNGPWTEVGQTTSPAVTTFSDSTSGAFHYVVKSSVGRWESAGSNTATAHNGGPDFDGIGSTIDNCPETFNLAQSDTDNDGLGDACDPSPTLATSPTLVDIGQSFGGASGASGAVGDLDGDGDLDLATANRSGQDNGLWLNDGSGAFSPSDQVPGSSGTELLPVGLDGDGDLDLVNVTKAPSPLDIWRNDPWATQANDRRSLAPGPVSAPVSGWA